MVVSSPITGAAIIGGELILSLADGGQIINCGLVQGPPGPKGSVGSPGPKGDAGLDGCTLLHGPGFPDPGLGKSGDFYWMVSPEVGVFGPKTAGGWGSPVILSRPITANKADYKPIAGQSGGGGATGDGGGPSKVYTNQVIPTGSGRLKSKNSKTTVEYFGSPNGILAPSGPLNSQANINGWIVKALEELDAVVPVAIVDTLPAAGEYTGDLVLSEGSLYIWAETEWVAVSSQGGAVLSDIRPVGDFEEGALWFCTADDDLTLYVYLGDGADQGWVPASPPVSLDGIDANAAAITELEAVVNKLGTDTAHLQSNVYQITTQTASAIDEFAEDQKRQDALIEELSGEFDEIIEEREKGDWIAEIPSTGSDGERDYIYDGSEFPGGGASKLDIGESGGPDGKGFVYFLCDLSDADPGGSAMAGFLTQLFDECEKDPDKFRGKYSFFCPWAADKGLAVREQPIDSISKSSEMTYTIHFYGPKGDEKEATGKGIEFFTEATDGHLPATGKFFMERYADASGQEQVCQEAYTKCLEDNGTDPAAQSNCLRELDACLEAAKGGWLPVSDFGSASAFVFNKTDASENVVTHTFEEVRAGDSIRITDSNTGQFEIANILSIRETDEHIRFAIKAISYSGGIVDGNKCEIEFYNFSLAPHEPDLDAYVKKTGDVMTGKLRIEKPRTDEGENSFIIRGRIGGKDANLLKDYQRQNSESNKDDYIEYFGSQASNKCIATKEYVDNAVPQAPANHSYITHTFLWEYVEGGKDKATSLLSNQFTYAKDGDDFVLYFSCYVNGQTYGPWHQTSHKADYGYISINNWNGRFAFGMWAKQLIFCQGKEVEGGVKKWWNEIRGNLKHGPSADSWGLTAGRNYHANLPSPWPAIAFPKSAWAYNMSTTFEIVEEEDLGDPLP